MRLEGDLDRIYVGNRKLHVNIPKYQRHQYEPRREERRTQGREYIQSQKEDRARTVRDDKGKGNRALQFGTIKARVNKALRRCGWRS